MNQRPYIIHPPRARFIDRLMYGIAYIVLLNIGVIMAFFVSVEANFPGWVLSISGLCGWLLLLSTPVSIYGVLADRYQFELGAIWFVIGGVSLLTAIAFGWAQAQNDFALASVVPLLAVFSAVVLFRRWNWLATVADNDRLLTRLAGRVHR